MFEDRNKNDLTKDITAAVWDWLDLRCLKPVETAVSVGNLGHPRVKTRQEGCDAFAFPPLDPFQRTEHSLLFTRLLNAGTIAHAMKNCASSGEVFLPAHSMVRSTYSTSETLRIRGAINDQ
jgi:hypothetical protein